MKFWKMQGIGNDFVVLNNEKITGAQAQKLADRRFGIGADQVLIAAPSKVADYQMIIFNQDGSEVEMCGNGIRAIALFALAQGLTKKKKQKIETKAGIKTVRVLEGGFVQVDMGPAVFTHSPDFPDNFINQEIHGFLGTCLSVGNPHCAIFVEDVARVPVAEIGPQIEQNPFFPQRINVEFGEVVSHHELKMRVWERGSGETLACGTGATALVIAAIKNGLCPANEEILVHLAGGDLKILWDEANNDAKMSGRAEKVFEGEI